MLKKRRPLRIGRILFILALIGGAVYVNAVIVPETPPLFVPTQTPTRAPETYIVDAEALALQGKFLQSIELYKEAISGRSKECDQFYIFGKNPNL